MRVSVCARVCVHGSVCADTCSCHLQMGPQGASSAVPCYSEQMSKRSRAPLLSLQTPAHSDVVTRVWAPPGWDVWPVMCLHMTPEGLHPPQLPWNPPRAHPVFSELSQQLLRRPSGSEHVAPLVSRAAPCPSGRGLLSEGAVL